MHAMKKSLALILIFLITLTACGAPSEQQNENPGNQPDEQQPEEVFLAIENGYVMKIDQEQQTFLITEYRSVSGQESIRAIMFRVDDKTEIIGADALSDFAVGTRVKAWNSGAIAESYPEQATAAKLEVLPPTDDSLINTMGMQLAIQAALDSEPASLAWAVKDVKLDQEKSEWAISLVSMEKISEPFLVHIDVKTEKIVEKPLMENDAFRLFAPEPNSIAEKKFTVRGQARVFEAAFSWTLEDGHSVLTEGHEMTDHGAPEWGNFEFEVSFETSSNSTLTLILYEASANDGSPQHELIVPLKVDEKLIKRAE